MADEDDLRRIASGDEKAFARLWDNHAREVMALGARYLGRWDDGEDIAQETFLRVWNQAGSFDPARGPARAWFFTIAANAARDQLRRRRLRYLVGLGDLPDELGSTLPDPAPDAEQHVAGRQRLGLGDREIARLPDTQRLALLLTAVAGLTAAEAASALGKSTGTVEQLVLRARRRLAERTGEGKV